jgi:hypothetical protein
MINEHQPVIPELGIVTLDITGRFPPQGWMEAGEGVTILRSMRKYNDISYPASTPNAEIESTRIHPGDEVRLAPGDQYALEGPGQVMIITTPAQKFDQPS